MPLIKNSKIIVIHLHYISFTTTFVRVHKSFSVTPAMQAGLMKKTMTFEDIALLCDYDAPKKRGSYKKNQIENWPKTIRKFIFRKRIVTMTSEKTFEMLKADTIKSYESYIRAIQNFSYNDIANLDKRLLLLEIYNKSVQINVEYRDFIINISKKFPPN